MALPGRARPSTDPSLAPGHYGAPLWHCKCAVQMESLSTFPLGLFPTEHSFLRIGFPGCCVRLPILPACCRVVPGTGTHRTSTAAPLRGIGAVSGSGSLRIKPRDIWVQGSREHKSAGVSQCNVWVMWWFILRSLLFKKLLTSPWSYPVLSWRPTFPLLLFTSCFEDSLCHS